jgi:hypothetical protein
VPVGLENPGLGCDLRVRLRPGMMVGQA